MSYGNNRGGGNFNGPPPKKTILNDWDMRLLAPPQQGAKREASISFALSQTNKGSKIKATLRTQVPGAKDDGVVNIQFNSLNFYGYLGMIKQAVDGKLEAGKQLIMEITKFFNQKTNVVAKLVVGVEQDGSIYTAILAGGQANIKFYFGPSDGGHLRFHDGSEVDRPTLTRIFAHAFATSLTHLGSNLLVHEFQEPAPKDGGGNRGGGGGGYNGGGNGGGGYQNNNGGGNSGGGGGAAPAADAGFDEFPDSF